MLGQHKIIIDSWAEVSDLLRPWADGEFWDFNSVDIDPAAIYIVGRLQLRQHRLRVQQLVNQRPGSVVFCNTAEGSQTALQQLEHLQVADLVREGKLGLMTSGDLEPGWNEFSSEIYFAQICTYAENLAAAQRSPEIYSLKKKPYDTLFLNGRLRPHRKYLIRQMRSRNMLQRSLYTCLETQTVQAHTSSFDAWILNQPETIQLLPPEYEIDRAVPKLSEPVPDLQVKRWLFSDTWGDAIVNPQAYIDTYFSVVTETVCEYPYSFRTEKIWKPMIMGHPWVCCANRGFYRDLRNLGFRTFDSLVNERFDLIDNNEDRVNALLDTMADILYNGADGFLQAARSICEYNQQHLQEFYNKELEKFPTQFREYLDDRLGISTASIG